MWCLFSIISHGMTAVCYPWLFAAICRGAASMMTRYGVRLVRQGDTAASSQWVCRNAPPQKGRRR